MTFAPGFRISLLDAVVLIGGIIGAFVISSYAWWAGMVIGFVVGHFFLFCNVFRIARKPELIWAAVFIVLIGATVLTGMPGWIVAFSVSFIVAVLLIYLEMQKCSYHGIFWSKINPGLREWWEELQSQK
jgi:hypothetical protein